jgi:hypothetical protein
MYATDISAILTDVIESLQQQCNKIFLYRVVLCSMKTLLDAPLKSILKKVQV